MNCPQCQSSNPPEAVRCARCDTPLELLDATLTDPDATTPGPAGGATMDVPEGWSVPAPVSSAAGVAASTILQPGTLLGNRYEILRMLGQGGMGAVYQAKDRELDRMVALKVIRPELAGRPEILRRFKQELILARQVTHRNVIRIFDLGEADGIKFITMQFIEGQDLRTLLTQKGRYSVEEAVGIIEQACLALEAAHAEGVVHRDLKPQNIMVDSQGKVSVMDFGIARSVELGGMTQTGALMGTPEYMSPEQVRGEEVDARSDLFTVGVIFCELVTGKMPYQADTALGAMFKRTRERATAPAELDPTVPRFISDVVARCLEIEPLKRYQSAREMLQDLEAWKGGASRSAAVPSLRWVRHAAAWQTLLAVSFAVLLLVVVGLVFRQKLPFRLSLKPGTAVESVSLAILPFRNASGDPAMDWLGSGLADMLATDVGESAHLRTISSDRLHQMLKDLRVSTAADADSTTLAHIAEFTSANVLVSGKYLKLGKSIRIDATLHDLKRQRLVPLKAEAPSEGDLLKAVSELARSIRENLALSPEKVRELQAVSFTLSSKSVTALRYYNEGLQLARQGNHLEALKRFEASTQEDPDFAVAYSKLAQTYATLGYSSKAEEFSRQAVDLSGSLPPAEKHLIQATYARLTGNLDAAIESYENLAKAAPANPQIHFELGALYESKGALDRAREHYARVLTSDPKHLDALYATARVEIRSRNYQAAVDYLNRALSLAIQLDNQESKARILNAIGVSYKRLDKPEEALRYYLESLAIREQLGDKGGMATSFNEIAQVHAMLGKPAAARENYLKALKIRREIGDKKGLAASLLDLGVFYQDRGQYAEALKLAKEALQLYTELRDENSQALCLSNIGVFYVAQGQFSDALIYYQRALQLREKLKIPGEMAETLYNLADTYSMIGQYGDALAHYLRALELWRSIGDKQGIAIASFGMGTLFGYQGRFGAALSAQEEALKTIRELGERTAWLGEMQAAYGNALILAGRGEKATKVLDEALSLARELHSNSLIARVMNYQGDRFFYSGDFKSARSLYEEALRAAQGTQDRLAILQSKVNQAKLAVEDSQAQAAAPALKTLVRDAEALGSKYLSAECSVLLGEALLAARNYSQARDELEVTLRSSEKFGLRALQAKAHFLLAKALEARGDKLTASRHSRKARDLLEEMQKELGSDTLLSRQDLKPIYAEAARPGSALPR